MLRIIRTDSLAEKDSNAQPQLISPSITSLAKQLLEGTETKTALAQYATKMKLSDETFRPMLRQQAASPSPPPQRPRVLSEHDHQPEMTIVEEPEQKPKAPTSSLARTVRKEDFSRRLSDDQVISQPITIDEPTRAQRQEKPVPLAAPAPSQVPERRLELSQAPAEESKRRVVAKARPRSAPRRQTQDNAMEVFYERTKMWQARRDAEVKRQKEIEEEGELAECSFRPRINQRPASAPRVRTNADVVTRLYNDGLRKRDLVVEEAERLKEEEFKEAHTFKPTTVAKRRTAVEARSRVSATPKQVHHPEPSAEFTFRPSIRRRPVSTRRDSLGVPAHERLYQMSQSVRQIKPPTTPAKVSSKASFDEFLRRQQQTQAMKQQHCEMMARQNENTFQPQLCSKSKQLVALRSTLGATERVRQKSRSSLENEQKECTFQPKIHARSQRLRPRTATELSLIDFQRAEAKKEQARLHKQQAELAEATFQPKIMSRGAHGRLQLNNDPDSYIDRVTRQAERQSVVRARAKATQLQKELKECTFTPAITALPRKKEGAAGAVDGFTLGRDRGGYGR
ncbi:pathogenesis-related genes transcriptional activator [Carpediemonas membranifera]|uniref:Pathogenesis-related genes transcriptional activator n=1 Tax=Carpediemonas membranifera TaxID=201153 RepID=A0A8J6B7C0_9EUKA|nr:pathogenesis-related genes transcriptional activator [Carpediemonas membranifera]|eukprot:KAG9391512.1 pathogenesis-related genes transcriptional activator [Carpediemonas membranifera]